METMVKLAVHLFFPELNILPERLLMSASIEHTSSVLATLGVHQRFWFWFSPDLPKSDSRLILSSLLSDPGMDQLTMISSQQNLPVGGRMSMGMGSINADGRVELGAPGLGIESLQALAEWVQEHATDHPALGRLKDSNMLAVEPSGVVRDAINDPSLWSGVVAPPVPGTLDGEAEILSSLPKGEKARFWISEQGPHLVVVPVNIDPKADLFRSRIRAFQRVVGQTPVVAGVLQATTAAIVLTTTSSLPEASKIVNTLVNTGKVNRLSGARIIQMIGGKFAAAMNIATKKLDLSRENEILTKITTEDRLVFWFTRDGANGKPLLVLETDKERLKETVKASGFRGSSIRGQARLTSKGWIEFRSRRDMKNFIPALAAFAIANQSSFTALSILKGARLTVRNDQGDITARYRNDEVWSSLTQTSL